MELNEVAKILREEYREAAITAYYSDGDSDAEKTCRAIFSGAKAGIAKVAHRLGIQTDDWEKGIKEEAEYRLTQQ